MLRGGYHWTSRGAPFIIREHVYHLCMGRRRSRLRTCLFLGIGRVGEENGAYGALDAATPAKPKLYLLRKLCRKSVPPNLYGFHSAVSGSVWIPVRSTLTMLISNGRFVGLMTREKYPEKWVSPVKNSRPSVVVHLPCPRVSRF